MRLRKLLLAAAAIVTAGAMALGPAAVASAPISNIDVNGSVSRSISLTLKSGSLTTNLWGLSSTVPCTAGTTVIATGAVNGGTSGISPNPAMVLNTLAPNCLPFIPGTTATISLTCTVKAVFADNVNTGFVDTSVDGTLQTTNGTSHCIRIAFSTGCTITVGGPADLQFDETQGFNGVQELHVNGGNLQVQSIAGSCVGAFTLYQSFVINAVFVVSVLGYFSIDFQ